jgi:predicted SprT family Zn-dependent metalloprotease
MRMILPPTRERRVIDGQLTSFFRSYRIAEFRRAVSAMCGFYKLKRPQVEWYEYLDWGKTGGKTYENGTIQLVHPENWKRGRKYNSERQWINMVYHEMGHYIFWVDAERKANMFAYRMVFGVNNHRNRHSSSIARIRHTK